MATIQFNDHFSTSPDVRSYISLWTLSLAPLIAHVVVGQPQTVYVTTTRPSIFQSIVQFNPTSILWRYFAIIDRRFRAREWDRVTVAVLNSVFWTARGWDNGEHIMEEHRKLLMRKPLSTHVQILSGSFIQTILIAFQGVQALMQFGPVTANLLGPFTTLALIFQPLAVFGLFRLIAAYWLVDDFVFSSTDDASHFDQLEPASGSQSPSDAVGSSRNKLAHPDTEKSDDVERIHLQSDEKLAMESQRESVARNVRTVTQSTSFPLEIVDRNNDRLHAINSWRGILVRAIFLLAILAIAGLSLTYLSFTVRSNHVLSATGLCMMVVYSFFTLSTAAIFVFSMFSARPSSTIVPGLNTLWYKIYTCILLGMFVIMFIVASIEQVQPPCDGSGGNCQYLTQLDNARLTFNVSFTDGKPDARGSLLASHLLFTGRYAGYIVSQNASGQYNRTIGGII